MSITVKFFASLREELGKNQASVQTETPLTVEQVWQAVNEDVPFPDSVLIAINFEYVNKETVVNDGDEVGFFPPVTGG